MPSVVLRLAILVAMLCSASAAPATPHHVVVVDFDGPRAICDSMHAVVVALVADHAVVVPTKIWEAAMSRASRLRGKDRWREASKATGVHAVIEGWVQDEGRHRVLTVSVRDASTGNEIDSVSARIEKGGLSDETRRKLGDALFDMLDWVDDGERSLSL